VVSRYVGFNCRTRHSTAPMGIGEVPEVFWYWEAQKTHEVTSPNRFSLGRCHDIHGAIGGNFEGVLVTILRGKPRLMHHMMHAELETSSRQQPNQKHCWVSSIPAIFWFVLLITPLDLSIVSGWICISIARCELGEGWASLGLWIGAPRTRWCCTWN
jgi:hypothetical protein